jgi:hypothetical protein
MVIWTLVLVNTPLHDLKAEFMKTLGHLVQIRV